MGGILQIWSARDASANPRAKCTIERALGTSKAVPLQIALGLTLEVCVWSHRDHGLSICPRGHGVAAGIAEMIVKFQPGYRPYLKIEKERPRSATRFCAVVWRRAHAVKF